MELAMDEGVFIRSMGTRGMLGGLTSAVYDVVEILDASGKDIVIVETVGVGQAEVDVIKIADSTLVVLVPGLGDSIQTIKAGVMEIADIYVINKADRPDVNQTVAEVKSLVDIDCSNKDRKKPVLTTNARNGEGIKELVNEIKKHKKYLDDSKEFDNKRMRRYEAELIEIIKKRLMNLIFDESKFKDKVESLIYKIFKKEVDPYTAADEILGKILK
jgi:LAO/AO transport system kinase